MRIYRTIGCVAAVLVVGTAHAETDFRELLLEAVRSPSGTAQANVEGPVAEKIRDALKNPNVRVLADVITVTNLKQEGCKQLSLRFTTPGTMMQSKEGPAVPFEMRMGVNMCPDGYPPMSEAGMAPVASEGNGTASKAK